MTLDDARYLQEKWKRKYGERICHHTQLFDYLRSENVRNADQSVCLVCGEVYVDSRENSKYQT